MSNNERTTTQEQLKAYLCKKVDVLSRCGNDPREQLGESSYNAAASPVIIREAHGTNGATAIKELAAELGLGYIEFPADELKALNLEELATALKERVPTGKEVGFLVFNGVEKTEMGSPCRVAAENLADASYRAFKSFKMPAKWILIITAHNDAATLGTKLASMGAVFEAPE